MKFEPNEVVQLPFHILREIVLNDALEPYVEAFKAKVWDGGFREQNAATNVRYHSYSFFDHETEGTIKVLSGSMAGRLMMTVQLDRSSVTIIGAEDEPGRGIGIQSIEGDVFEARRLLELVTHQWPFTMKPEPPDGAIGIGPRQYA